MNTFQKYRMNIPQHRQISLNLHWMSKNVIHFTFSFLMSDNQIMVMCRESIIDFVKSFIV